MRGLLAIALLTLAGTRLHAAPVSEPVDAYPDVARAYRVEIDGAPVWAGRADARLPMASLTKLMTALLIAEEGNLEATVTVSKTSALATGTRLDLRPGERYLARDLFTAMLVRSANDVCRALADWHGGTAEQFVSRMNRRAADLGLRDTRFENACGHDGPAQYSSANDLAVLARAAMAQPDIAAAVALPEFAFASLAGRRHSVRATNALIGSVEGTRGLKTGFTPGAGRCLIAVVERGGVEVLVVLLHAPDRWWDTVGLVELAFEQARQRRVSIPQAGR